MITRDELASDAYDPKLVDDIVYEIDCSMIVIKDGDVDTGELSCRSCCCEKVLGVVFADQAAGELGGSKGALRTARLLPRLYGLYTGFPGCLLTILLSSGSTGANASAEEQQEALEDGAKQVINAVRGATRTISSAYADNVFVSIQVHSFRLQSTQFDKKSYLTYLKGYMKSVKKYLEANNPDRVEAFEKGAQTFAKKGGLQALRSPACV